MAWGGPAHLSGVIEEGDKVGQSTSQSVPLLGTTSCLNHDKANAVIDFSSLFFRV